MKTIYKICFIAIILLMVGIGVVSAADTGTNTTVPQQTDTPTATNTITASQTVNNTVATTTQPTVKTKQVTTTSNTAATINKEKIKQTNTTNSIQTTKQNSITNQNSQSKVSTQKTTTNKNQNSQINSSTQKMNTNINQNSQINSSTQKTATTKVTPEIKMNNYTATLKDNVTFTAKIADNATGQAVFKINGKTISNKIDLVNGTATYTYQLPSTYRATTYKLQVIYSGDSYYSNTTATSKLKLNKIPTTATLANITSKPGNTIMFDTVVVNKYNEAVANTTVIFKFGGLTVGNNITDSKGHAVFYYTIPTVYNKQSYVLSMVSKQNKENLESRQNANITLTQLATKIQVTNITAQPGNYVTITGIVKDENNNPVLSGKASIKLNGKNIKTVTVSNGFAKYTFSVPYSNATKESIIIIYGNYTKYGPSKGIGTLTITKLDTQMTINRVDTKPGETATITATVIDSNNKAVTSGTVIFKLNNTIIGQANVTNGVASYSYNVPFINAGKSVITANYQSNNQYTNSSQSNVFLINKLNTIVKGDSQTATVGTAVTSTVTLVDESGYNVNNGTVKFYINNNPIKSVIVNNGVASVTYTPSISLMGTTATITAVYYGTNIYNASTGSLNLTISKLSNVYVSTTGSDSNMGNQLHPFKTISYALSHVALFGTVNILKGTYNTNNVIINQSVKIKGTGPTTIINGTSNGKTIFTINDADVSVVIDKMTIQNGRSTSNNSAGAIVNNGKLNIYNTLFLSNVANGPSSAGAIFNTGLLNITLCKFTKNSATTANSEGGAIRNIGNNTIIKSTYFDSNKVTGYNSTGGGAIYNNNGNINLITSNFVNNSAVGKTVTGGAIKIVNGNVTFTNDTFTGNSVSGTDYGIGGAVGNLNANLYIANTKFIQNTAKGTNTAGAGALYNQYCLFMMYNSTFINNMATSKAAIGGAMYNYYTYTYLENSQFTSNKLIASKTNALGGAIDYTLGTLTGNNVTFTNNYASGNSSYGGAIYFSGTSLNLNKTTFLRNNATAKSAAAGGAMFVDGNVTIGNSTFSTNKALANNNGGGAIANIGNLTVTYTNFVNNAASAVGSAISNSGTVKSVENNYWGSSSPTWSSILYNVGKPNKYSRTYINQ